MIVVLFGLLLVGAGLVYWLRTDEETLWEPKQQYLATLLVLATTAINARNHELYQATIKEIVCLMSRECWERPEVNWRLSQALLIAKEDAPAHLFEKVKCVSQNITRYTVHNPKVLPWEVRPFIKLLAKSVARLAA